MEISFLNNPTNPLHEFSRWRNLGLPDEFTPWLKIAEAVAGEMKAKHPRFTLLDDGKLVMLAQGLAGLSSYFPDHDPVSAPPAPETDTNYSAESKRLERIGKQAEKLHALLNSHVRVRKELEVTFATEVDPVRFFEDEDAFINWPERSLQSNKAYADWLEGLAELQRAVTSAVELLQFRASLRPSAPATKPTITTIRAELVPQLFERVYDSSTKGGTRGGRELTGPIYTFQTAVLSRISDLKTTAGSLRQAQYRNL